MDKVMEQKKMMFLFFLPFQENLQSLLKSVPQYTYYKVC